MKIEVDRIGCDGAGVCAELLPEHISLDEWGYPIVENPDVPANRHARRAAALCPNLALHLRPAPSAERGSFNAGGEATRPSRPGGARPPGR
jgi:ferredoxin